MLFHYIEAADLGGIFGSNLFSVAWTAVDLFFIISGFILLFSYREKIDGGMSFFEYASSRLIRLYPCAFLSVVAAGAVRILLIKSGMKAELDSNFIFGFINNLFLIPMLHDPVESSTFRINPPLWSVFFEILASFYLFFVCKMEKFKIKRVGLMCAAIMMIVAAANKMFGISESIDWNVGWNTQTILYGFPRVLFGFSLGNLIFFYSHDPVDAANWSRWLMRVRIRSYWCLLLTLVVLMVPWGGFGLASIVIVWLVMPCLVVFAVNGITKTRAEWACSDFMGEISYPLYCIHWPVYQMSLVIFRYRWPNAINMHSWHFVGLVSFSSVAFSMLISRFYDAPVRRWLRGVAARTFAPRSASNC